MKLHLTKSLRMALLGGTCLAAQAMAADVPAVDGYGNIWISQNTEIKAEDAGKDILIHSNYNDLELNVAENTTVGVKIGAWYNESKSFIKTGDGTLQLTGAATVIQNGTPALTIPKNATVNGGTLEVTYGNTGGFVGETVTVNGDATLKISHADALGNPGNAGTDTVILNGKQTTTTTIDELTGEETTVTTTETAKLVLNAWTNLTSELQLNGHTNVSGTANDYGTYNMNANGGKIVATGTDNVIDTNLVVRKEFVVTAKNAGDSVTLNGSIKKAGNDISGANSTTFTKNGDGKLILGASTTIDEGLTMNLADGTLDFSNVATFDVTNLNLAAGTTVILAEGTRFNISGALTIGDGVIFDLSNWTSLESFDPYALFTLGTGATFTPPTNKYVTILAQNNGINDKAFLTYDATTNKVMLVPEPTTATLSLLALAGLAARRRRK